MDPHEYQLACSRTECDQHKSRDRLNYVVYDRKPLLPVRLNHAVIGLMGEVGELAAEVERWIYYGKELDQTNLTEELGDCLWYISEACNALGINLGDVMTANIRKLRARYPDKYADNKALNRDVTNELAALRNDRAEGEE